jgi:hypothetical protein
VTELLVFIVEMATGNIGPFSRTNFDASRSYSHCVRLDVDSARFAYSGFPISPSASLSRSKNVIDVVFFDHSREIKEGKCHSIMTRHQSIAVDQDAHKFQRKSLTTIL